MVLLTGARRSSSAGTCRRPRSCGACLCGISQAFGVWWFYAALGAGPMSVVSPLTAILVAVCPSVVGRGAGGAAVGARVRRHRAGVGRGACWSAAKSRDDGCDDRTASPRRWRWLTVGSGLAFGLNFVLIDQAPVEAGCGRWCSRGSRRALVVVVIALVTGNLRVRRRACRCGWRSRRASSTPSPTWRCCWRCRRRCCRWPAC